MKKVHVGSKPFYSVISFNLNLALYGTFECFYVSNSKKEIKIS